jgi:hypothetical protein
LIVGFFTVSPFPFSLSLYRYRYLSPLLPEQMNMFLLTFVVVVGIVLDVFNVQVPKHKINDETLEIGELNNCKIGRIEDKMGCHGSSTCEINFEDSVGTLIGTENRGLNHMFTFINTSRIGKQTNKIWWLLLVAAGVVVLKQVADPNPSLFVFVHCVLFLRVSV